ncbi:hypothetical protein ACONUD_15885 [Microbulbifer harenosus]|uniref:Uncharacterized protein n=1 Tax=Microbulbifer harenosus TaxID=2576840 RepID=A0ABY2UEX3_9GAMM|nr:hypothetical protein [Microbulbifer harenosus]TLM75712.1 hypothetical protein FDY93_15575 [Microbulbifer harenosus]
MTVSPHYLSAAGRTILSAPVIFLRDFSETSANCREQGVIGADEGAVQRAFWLFFGILSPLNLGRVGHALW